MTYRYVRGFDRDVVADQLGISGRQFRRERRAALETLAQHIWQMQNLEGRPALAPSAEPEAQPPAWLNDLPPEKPGDLQVVLAATLDLARALARQWDVRVESATAAGTGPVAGIAVPQTALRYALLNVLGVAVPRATGHAVNLATLLAGDTVVVEVVASTDAVRSADRAGGLTEEERASLEVARQLLDVIGGQVEAEAGPAGFHRAADAARARTGRACWS